MTIAQVSAEWGAPLAQMGALGIVVGWFMFRNEKRMVANEHAIDRLAKAILILVVTIESGNPATKHQANGLLKELEKKNPTSDE